MSWASQEWLDSVDDAVREDTLRHLRDLRQTRGATFWVVLELISRADPEGLLGMGAPPDEYARETSTVYERLPQARSAEDVRRILEEEFARWFGTGPTGRGTPWVDPNYRIGIPITGLEGLAGAIWNPWGNRQRDEL
jgi:hypothetical protein